MERTLKKALRDLVVMGTLGQVLAILIDFLPVVGELYNLSPQTLGAASATLALAMALYRVLRDHVDRLAEVDQVG